MSANSEGGPIKVVYLMPDQIKIGERFRKDLGDISDLKESIAEVGLLQPIGVTADGQLVYGQRRLEAWKQARPNEPIPCVIVDGDLYQLKLKELHENIKRKSMHWSEEVLAREEIKQIYAQLYGWKPRGNPNFLPGKKLEGYTQQKLADEMNISVGMLSIDLQLAQALKEYPELAKMQSKKAAYHRLIFLKKREQLSQNAGELPEKVKLYNCSFEEAPIPDESVDVILTDPPYAEEYVEARLYEKLGAFARRVLKPTGLLIFYAGTASLPQKLWQVNQYLNYFWCEIKIMRDTGGVIYVKGQRINQRAKLTWIFYKEDVVLPDTFGYYWIDVYESNEKPEKILHPWEQEVPYAEYLLKKYAMPNAVICDPMFGSGSFLIAAIRTGHPCIGVEIDPEVFKLAKARILAELSEGPRPMT